MASFSFGKAESVKLGSGMAEKAAGAIKARKKKKQKRMSKIMQMLKGNRK